MVTGDFQEEVIIFRDKQTHTHFIIIYISGQTGQPGQTGQTGQTDLTFKLDFPGNLCRAAFAILVMFLHLIYKLSHS